MKGFKWTFFLSLFLMFTASVTASGEAEMAVESHPLGEVVGDALPGAPEMAKRGLFKVGVQSALFINLEQVDVLNSTDDQVYPVYDRKINVEIWYPAILSENEVEYTEYTEHIGRLDQDNLIPFTFWGRAARNASPNKGSGPFPLIILSHGFPGSTYMMSYLGENLASKGYVVAAIGHTESTYEDVSGFVSTMINRKIDQKFVIDKMLTFDAVESSFKGLIDAQKIGLIGYSMGGYGALQSLGAGCNEIVDGWFPAFSPLIKAKPEDKPDSRIKAAVVFAPWGGAVNGAPTGLMDTESLKKITAPTLWVAGSLDDVAGYDGIVNLFEASSNSDRYLLTFENALHNVAPNPAPPEAVTWDQASRWSDPVWDSRRMNNINQHFVSVFMDLHLKGNADSRAFLDVEVESSNMGVYSIKDGIEDDTHTYWPGFEPRSAVGLQLRHITP